VPCWPANADTAVLQRYDSDLDAAFEQAREHRDLTDLTPLVETVRRWWFEADAACAPSNSSACNQNDTM